MILFFLTIMWTLTTFMFVNECNSVNPNGQVCGNDIKDKNSALLQMGDLIDSWYYMFTTLSTTGYGDISPKSTLGRLFIVLCIAGTMLLLGYLILFAEQTLSEVFFLKKQFDALT